MRLERLLPTPSRLMEPSEAYAAAREPVGARPWVLVTMVASVDGAATLDGRSEGLGGEGDRAVFSTLRSLADVVLVGAATVRAERYRPPRTAGQRIAVVTRSGALDWSWDLFTSGAALAMMPEDGADVPVPTVRAGLGEVDLAAALALLEADVVVCEGGPSLNAQLFAADVVDELCVTVAPTLLAGTATRIAAGAPTPPRSLRLEQVCRHGDELFLRYLRDR